MSGTRSVAISASHKLEEESSAIKTQGSSGGSSRRCITDTKHTAAPVWSAHAAIPFREDVERNATAPHFPGDEETCTKVGNTSCLRGNRGNQASTVRQGGEVGTLNLKELVSSEEAQRVKDAAGDVARGAAQTATTTAAQDFATTQLGVPGAVASAATQFVTKVVTK